MNTQQPMTTQETIIPIAQEELRKGFEFFFPGVSITLLDTLGRTWLDGIITADEGQRIVEGRQIWQEVTL